EASLLPVADWPLLRLRMRYYESLRGRYWKVAHAQPGLIADVLSVVKELGPISAGGIENALAAESSANGGWWNRSTTQVVCEFVCALGASTPDTPQWYERQCHRRERVLPPEVLAAPEIPKEDAIRELTARAAESLRVGTEIDLRDYYRIKPAAAKQAI